MEKNKDKKTKEKLRKWLKPLISSDGMTGDFIIEATTVWETRLQSGVNVENGDEEVQVEDEEDEDFFLAEDEDMFNAEVEYEAGVDSLGQPADIMSAQMRSMATILDAWDSEDQKDQAEAGDQDDITGQHDFCLQQKCIDERAFMTGKHCLQFILS